ncbi:MAG: flavodoxin family protein [Spirochaetales bacterium]|nr:flavodoxin family protein [Spirochaetales bacterium]
MNVVIVNGIDDISNWEGHNQAINSINHELNSRGHKVDCFNILDMNFHYCQGCWDCWTRTPGKCRMKDEGEVYLKALKNVDCLLFFSPVKAGFVTAETKKALDRFVPNALPFINIYEKECHHLERYPKSGKTLGVVLLDDGSISNKSAEIIYNNFTRIQKNMKINKSIRFKLTPNNTEELLNEIINN